MSFFAFSASRAFARVAMLCWYRPDIKPNPMAQDFLRMPAFGSLNISFDSSRPSLALVESIYSSISLLMASSFFFLFFGQFRIRGFAAKDNYKGCC